MSEDENAVVERPRWAARELIFWLVAGLLLVEVLALVAAAFSTVDTLRGPGAAVQVSTPNGRTDGQPGNQGLPLPPGTVVVDDDEAQASFGVPEPPLGLCMLAGTGTLLAGLGTFAAALYGRLVLLWIGQGSAFDRRNPRRLAGVAAVGLVVGGVLVSVAQFVADEAVLAHLGIVPDDGTPAALHSTPGFVELDGLLWALIAPALAGAFRSGRRLAEDADGLV